MSITKPYKKFGDTDLDRAIGEGRKILFIVSSAKQAKQLIDEIGGIKHPKIDSYFKFGSVHSMRSAESKITIISKADFAISLCGVRCHTLVVETDDLFNEEETQTHVMPFFAVRHNPKEPNSLEPEIFKLR